MKWLRTLTCLWPFYGRRSVRDDSELQKEKAWYKKEFRPKDGADYAITLRYAENNFKDVKDTFSALDKKADWLYAATIASIGAVYIMSGKNIAALAWGLPSLFFSALAFINIMRTKTPGERPGGMTTRGAIECAEHDAPSAFISANLHCATKELTYVNAWKAARVTGASYAVIFAFALAPLTLLAPSSKVHSDQTPPAESRCRAAPTVRLSLIEIDHLAVPMGRAHQKTFCYPPE